MARHLLNFEPSVKFRTGSRFLYHSCLVMLYGIPVLIGLQMVFANAQANRITAFLSEHATIMEKRCQEFKSGAGQFRLDPEEQAVLPRQAAAYSRVLLRLGISWRTLLDQLESVQPAGIRFLAVRIRPQDTVQLSLEGEGGSLTDVTLLLRQMLAHPLFLRPFLSQHQLEPGGRVRFTLQADYVPPVTANEVKP